MKRKCTNYVEKSIYDLLVKKYVQTENMEIYLEQLPFLTKDCKVCPVDTEYTPYLSRTSTGEWEINWIKNGVDKPLIKIVGTSPKEVAEKAYEYCVNTKKLRDHKPLLSQCHTMELDLIILDHEIEYYKALRGNEKDQIDLLIRRRKALHEYYSLCCAQLGLQLH